MVIIDTSSVLSYIKEMSGGGCSPIRQPHQAHKNKSRRARAAKQQHVLRSLERIGHRVGPMAPETRDDDDDDDDSSITLDAIVDGVVEEIIRDTTSATSAAFKSVQGSATAMIFPPPYSPPSPPPPPPLGEEYQEITTQLPSTPEAAAASSPEVVTRTALSPAAPPAPLSAPLPETVESKTTPTITTIDKEKFQTLISRSQARRKKLQQSYNEIMSSNAPVSSIQEQHNQYQQQSRQEERSDRETTISLSPRVRKRYYDFDIREVEEYIPTHHHHQSSNTSNAYEWDSAQLRRERRISMQDEIDQLTKDVRLITMQRSPPKVNDDDSKTTKLQQLVEEFEEEWKMKWKTTPTQTSNLKRRIDLDIKKRSINEDDAKITDTVTTRWKGSQGKKSIPDDQLEAWWKERQAKQSFSAGERFDTWWKNQKEMKNTKHAGGGGSGVAGFQELEGEPTVEDDVGTTLSSVVPSKEDRDTVVSSRRDGEEGFNKEQHDDAQSSVIGGPSTSPTAASDPLITEDLSSLSQSHANNVASGALKIVLSRIDEAKAQFVKALKDNDVQKQSELAALISRLGEAAVNLRKLGEN